MLGTILVVILILALIGAFPRWGYSSGWGYGPSGIVGVILIVVLILALTGRSSTGYCTNVFFTSATSCFSVNGFARNAYCSWLGRFLLKASSA
jgi:hypothetical protein